MLSVLGVSDAQEITVRVVSKTGHASWRVCDPGFAIQHVVLHQGAASHGVSQCHDASHVVGDVAGGSPQWVTNAGEVSKRIVESGIRSDGIGDLRHPPLAI